MFFIFSFDGYKMSYGQFSKKKLQDLNSKNLFLVDFSQIEHIRLPLSSAPYGKFYPLWFLKGLYLESNQKKNSQKNLIT